LTERISGFGLGVGVALGIGIGLFKKFSEQIIEANKSYGDLEAELGKPVEGLGVEGLSASLDKLDARIDEFTQKHSSFIERLKEAFNEGGVLGAAGSFVTGGRSGPQGETAQELNKAFEQQRDLRNKVAQAESEIVDNQETSLKVSEEQAELDKVSVATEEKKAKIVAETYDRREALQKVLRDDEENRKTGLKLGLSEDVRHQYQEEIDAIGEADAKRLQSAERSKQLQQDKIQQEYELRNAALAIRRQESQESLEGQTVEQAKTTQLSNQLGLIDDQLQRSKQLTAEKRAQLEADKAGTQANLRQTQQKNFFQPFDLFKDLEGGIREKLNRKELNRDITQKLREDAGLSTQDSRRDFRKEQEEDNQLVTDERKKNAGKMRYHGLTKEQAYESLTDEEKKKVPAPAGMEALGEDKNKKELADRYIKEQLGGQGTGVDRNKAADIQSQIDAQNLINQQLEDLPAAGPPMPKGMDDLVKPPPTPEVEDESGGSTDLSDLPDKVAKAVSDVMKQVWG